MDERVVGWWWWELVVAEKIWKNFFFIKVCLLFFFFFSFPFYVCNIFVKILSQRNTQKRKQNEKIKID